MPRTIDHRKHRLWQSRIARWQASGLTVRAFCSRHNCSEQDFYRWRRVLAARDAATPNPHQQAPLFVPVAVPVAARCSAIEVVLGTGRSVRVAPGFDPDTLREVVTALEGLPC